MTAERRIKIAPSILSADFSRLGEQVAEAEQGGADAIHIDIMDGNFVPNITMGPMIVDAIRGWTTLPFDLHMMVSAPERYIEDFASAGADIITVHAEACQHLHRTVHQIREAGKKPSVAISPRDTGSCNRRGYSRPGSGSRDDRKSRLRRPGVHRIHARQDQPRSRNARRARSGNGLAGGWRHQREHRIACSASRRKCACSRISRL